MKKLLVIAATLSFLSGCASVPMADNSVSSQAKEFKQPSPNKAGLYIYRSGYFGYALKKDIWVDGDCIGESAPDTFFYTEVQGNAEHKISTESEFSPNDLLIKANSNQNYFVKQYIKPGLFVGGAGLELVNEEIGRKSILKLKMAQKGNCSK